jgi:hypothetical protein
MSNSKSYNQILFITTLSVCFGLVLVGASPIFGQREYPLEPKPPRATKSPDESNRREFSKRPLKDFAKEVNAKVQDKKIDLFGNVSVGFRGLITREGKFDPKKSNFLAAQGDAELINIVKAGILAINDSGYLSLIGKFSVETVTVDVSFVQNEIGVIAEVQAEMVSDARANTTKTLLDLAIQFGKNKKNKGISIPNNPEPQNDRDELVLLEKVTIEVLSNKIIVRLNVPKELAIEMINRKLKELADDEVMRARYN